MTIKLILAKTNYDPINAWTDIKTVEVDIPLVSQDGWNVIGADWEVIGNIHDNPELMEETE